MNNKPLLTGLLLAIGVVSGTGTASAAEGGASHYLPGMIGDMFIAVPPQPGFLIANTVFVQSGSADRSVLQGRVNVGVDVDLVLNFIGGTYTVDVPALGGTYTVALALPFGYADLSADAITALGIGRSRNESAFDISDLAFTPLQLNWNFGEISVRLSETIIAPTGGYDTEELINLGRNYWSFDTVGAVTWFKPTWGTEVSVAPGIMLNTSNEDTDYKTGHEFHVDFVANQFFSKTFALGLRGYYYRQVTGDSGSGAVLGGFESEGLGLGPGVFWAPDIGAGQLLLTAKYMHDITSTNRFNGHYGLVTAAWKF